MQWAGCLWLDTIITFTHLLFLVYSTSAKCCHSFFCFFVGSLLDTPYPFSPGTSPEPTSPVIAATSENVLSISTLETGRSDVEADSSVSSTGSEISLRGMTASPHDHYSTAGTADATFQNPASHTWSSSSAGHTDASDRITKTVSIQPMTSSMDLISNCEPAVSRGSSIPPGLSSAETLAALPRLNASTAASTPGRATVEPCLFTAKPESADRELTFTNSPVSSNQELSTFTPVPTYAGGPGLLESLEDLVQRGDDARLPHYLHQVFYQHYLKVWALTTFACPHCRKHNFCLNEFSSFYPFYIYFITYFFTVFLHYFLFHQTRNQTGS